MKQKKNGSSHSLGNRTVVGFICIAVALAICFGIAPLVNRLSDGKTEIVRMIREVPAGHRIEPADIELTEVGSFNLPDSVITKAEDVIGKCAQVNLYCGEYLVPEKLGNDLVNAQSILESLDADHKAISVTIGSFALGLSGKLETGDIVSVIVYDDVKEETFTPKQLNYVKVITSTTTNGVDKADVDDNSQPVTVTLLVNDEQAELLAYYEKHGDMHIVLEYRGDPETAQKYLDAQDAVLKGGE